MEKMDLDELRRELSAYLEENYTGCGDEQPDELIANNKLSYFACGSGTLALPQAVSKIEVDEIELVGLCTDICVISNAMILKAAFPEVTLAVDASCCAGVTPESHATALAAMKMCQIEIRN